MPAKILIVEDSKVIVGYLFNFLTEGGHRVVVSRDGDRVDRMVETERPDLLILDYNLPVGNGAEILEKVRCVEAGKNLPVIILTGKPLDEVRVPESDTVKIFSKPPDTDKLRAAITQLLRGRAA